VDGLDNWKYGLDLGNYAPANTTLSVEGKDKAGNVTRATPMNIYIDPKSDLPIVSIINPISLMRIGGDLNIVGTCAAPRALDRVENQPRRCGLREAEGGSSGRFSSRRRPSPRAGARSTCEASTSTASWALGARQTSTSTARSRWRRSIRPWSVP